MSTTGYIWSTIGYSNVRTILSTTGSRNVRKILSAIGSSNVRQILSTIGSSNVRKILSTIGSINVRKILSQIGSSNVRKILSTTNSQNGQTIMTTTGSSNVLKILSTTGSSNRRKIMSTTGSKNRQTIMSTTSSCNGLSEYNLDARVHLVIHAVFGFLQICSFWRKKNSYRDYGGVCDFWSTNENIVKDYSVSIQIPTISLEMPVPSQGHYGFHSFSLVDWFCLFIYLCVFTFPLEDCSQFGNFVITFIYQLFGNEQHSSYWENTISPIGYIVTFWHVLVAILH